MGVRILDEPANGIVDILDIIDDEAVRMPQAVVDEVPVRIMLLIASCVDSVTPFARSLHVRMTRASDERFENGSNKRLEFQGSIAYITTIIQRVNQ